MSTQVTLPQLGESVVEGTVSRWLKRVGEAVAADEALLEVSTDKVDTEIPSPVAGVLLEIVVQEDESAQVGAVLAVVGDPAEAPAPVRPAPQAPDPDALPLGGASLGVTPSPQAPALSRPLPPELPDEGPYVTPLVRKLAEEHGVDLGQVRGSGVGGRIRKQDVLELAFGARSVPEPRPILNPAATFTIAPPAPDAPPAAAPPTPVAAPATPSTPVPPPPAPATPVAAPSRPATPVAAPPVPATRAVTPPVPATPVAAPSRPVTPVATPPASAARVPPPPLPATRVPAPPAPATRAAAPPVPATPGAAPSTPATPVPPVLALAGTTERISRLRATVARRMVDSLRTSAQLTATVEADLTAIARLRAKVKDSFKAREGVGLSYLPFIAKAAIEALRQYPKLNATLDEEAALVAFPDGVHIGVAVDTPKGLLVPVVRHAEELSVGGLARKIGDLAERTRNNRVTPDELAGGTFTITNYGSTGTLFDTPIINQPQVGILGTGAVVKRPVVVQEKLGEIIAVRDMMYLSLTYDHRLVDGADASRFLALVKARLEVGEFGAEFGVVA
ncbi:MAG: 2-oxo acid dehydrogenase subunit E2 [Propionibacteriaceae bacterium]|jgi:2-oxoglutarate dehydrogenase E2 component (dihydrolipoamide succinyltransferase)|nr:2-oxo acid dehydrogenase subunit E2 [Propionibacteriaceae bacterium]